MPIFESLIIAEFNYKEPMVWATHSLRYRGLRCRAREPQRWSALQDTFWEVNWRGRLLRGGCAQGDQSTSRGVQPSTQETWWRGSCGDFDQPRDQSECEHECPWPRPHRVRDPDKGTSFSEAYSVHSGSLWTVHARSSSKGSESRKDLRNASQPQENVHRGSRLDWRRCGRTEASDCCASATGRDSSTNATILATAATREHASKGQ